MASFSNAPSNNQSFRSARRVKADAETSQYWRAAEAEAKDSAKPKAAERTCDHPDCAAPGAYRAPKSRQQLNEFHWFCLPHVQEYNKAWNYYSGLSIDEMEDVRRLDIVGWRPTWPLGKLGAADRHADVSADALRSHIFTQFFGGKAKQAGAARKQPADPNGLSPEETAAMSRLGLSLKASWYEIKRRYRELALAHHPDLHAEADAAEQIKGINRAYTVLKRRQARVQAKSS